MSKEIFYGAAIQGQSNRGERAHIHRTAIDVIKTEGFSVLSEHTSGQTRVETIRFLDRAIGSVADGRSRASFVRRSMLRFIDRDSLSGVVFEVSTPSTGTGIEIEHACTREERRLDPVPILALYERDYWPHGLSTMVRGIEEDEIPNFRLEEYEDVGELARGIRKFLRQLR